MHGAGRSSAALYAVVGDVLKIIGCIAVSEPGGIDGRERHAVPATRTRGGGNSQMAERPCNAWNSLGFGRPCFFHRAGALRRVVLDDHEGGDDRHRREDEPSEPAAVAAPQGVEVLALISHVAPAGACNTASRSL